MQEILAQGRHLHLLRRQGWEFVQRPRVKGVVAILARHQGDLLLVEQERPPLGCRVIELPAGLVGDEEGLEEEDLASAAARELLEETGFEASRFLLLGRGPSSAGLTDELITFVLAEGLRQVGPGGGAGSEAIVVHRAPERDLGAWLAEAAARGRLIDPKIHAALHMGLLAGHQGPEVAAGPALP